MKIGGARNYALMICATLALAACESPNVVQTSPAPLVRPPEPVETVKTPSAESEAMGEYYARIQQNYVSRGLLRVDGGGPDTPFNSRQLVDNFVKIALHEEFSTSGDRIIRQESATRLHRWNGPVRLKLEFGETVPAAQRDKDRASVTSYANRLARLTGLNIALSDRSPNFHLFIVNEDERKTIGPKLQAISGDINSAAVSAVQNMRQITLCLVFAIDSNNDGIYNQAIAVVRGEHPDLLRLSCIHEELAQGLGLPNDSPAARPSVFNDDEEFGLLTTHDEMLLRMLYDPRMRPGMTAIEARPVAQAIASELLGGES